MLKAFKYLKSYQWLMLAVQIGFVCVQVNFDLKLPEYMASILAEVRAMQTGAGSVSAIWGAGWRMLLIAGASLLSALFAGFFAALVGSGLSRTLREKLYSKVNDFSMEEIHKFSIASLITRTTNDVGQVVMSTIMIMRIAISAPITAIWAFSKILGKSPQLSIVTASGVIAVIALISVILVFGVPKFRILQKLTDGLNGRIRENLTGLRVVRAFNAESYQESKFQRVNEEYTRTTLFVGRLNGLAMPGMHLILGMVGLAIVFFGAFLVRDGAIEYETIMLFTTYSVQILFSFLMLSMVMIMIPRAQVSAKRINEVLNTPISIVDGAGANPQIEGEVCFDKVSFKYPNAEDWVLHDISFTAKKGQTVAFIGSTGSGKSTLINLIPRFYDATEGQILVDGVDIKDYKISQLNDKIGYIPQHAFLFGGSIADNISYGKQDASSQEIFEAIGVSQATDFVEGLEESLDYHIASGGKNVSGGQRQRLSIARAVVKKPEFYIFDDSFSALDFKTDKNLRAALKEYTKNSTTFIVASRIGTILDADQILVLEQGRLVGIGTHQQLLSECEVYQEIAYSQLSKEELQS